MLPESYSQKLSTKAGLRVQDETLISERSKCCSTCESKDRRKFLYAYNVFEEKGNTPVLKYDSFHFLDPQKLVEPPKNTFSIDPLKVGLPWFSTMKGALQCIHWREAEAAG
ncbi:terpenoid synthase [Penicillium malachiteum]|nr:terpenoid synthase [Penicillium malachiteum]